MSANDNQNNLNFDSLLTKETLLKDEIMKTAGALDNAQQTLKSLKVNIELHSNSLKTTINKKGDLLQQQWQILNQQELKSREKAKEKMHLLIMEDQQKILLEILENEKVAQENCNCKNYEDYLINKYNELILKRKKYEKQLYDLEQEIRKKEEQLKKVFNNFCGWVLDNK